MAANTQVYVKPVLPPAFVWHGQLSFRKTKRNLKNNNNNCGTPLLGLAKYIYIYFFLVLHQVRRAVSRRLLW